MVKQSSLRKKFNLDEEVLCDYKVSSKMKKVWKVELDLLEAFIKVCQKYHLNYFLYGGTLLGAIRHDGFIPWDDDIDVGMLREDYNKLLEIAPKEFHEPYFFQTSFNDSVFRGHAQLRNSETAAIIKNDIHLNFNQGIFIDIFVIDKVPNGRLFQNIFYTRLKIYNFFLKSYYHLSQKGRSKREMIRLGLSRILFKFVSFESLFKKYNCLSQKYNKRENCKYCTDAMFILAFKNDIVLYTDYQDLTTHAFEYLECSVPKNYDRILRTIYGDYTVIKKGTQTHKLMILDPEKSYKEYLNNSDKI